MKENKREAAMNALRKLKSLLKPAEIKIASFNQPHCSLPPSDPDGGLHHRFTTFIPTPPALLRLFLSKKKSPKFRKLNHILVPKVALHAKPQIRDYTK